MEPRKGRDGGAKHGFSWGGMGRVGYRIGSLGGKWLNVRLLQKCAKNGVFGCGVGRGGKKPCRFWGGMLRMWSVGCGMLGVQCWVLDVEC